MAAGTGPTGLSTARCTAGVSAAAGAGRPDVGGTRRHARRHAVAWRTARRISRVTDTCGTGARTAGAAAGGATVPGAGTALVIRVPACAAVISATVIIATVISAAPDAPTSSAIANSVVGHGGRDGRQLVRRLAVPAGRRAGVQHTAARGGAVRRRSGRQHS